MKSYDRLLAAIVLSALMLTSVFTYEMSAQNQRIKVTVSGHITDKASGETLSGPGCSLKAREPQRTTTDFTR